MIVHIPFGLYLTFKIEVPAGMSEATLGDFICERLMTIIEYVLVSIIGLLVISIAAKISGNWLWLLFLLSTGLFKCLILILYPMFIMPLFS